MAARSWLWRSSSIKALRHCGRVPLGGQVGVKVSGASGERVAGIAGVSTCSSVWACPCCSAKIAGVRTGEVADVLTQWKQHTGGRVIMVTLTVRHDASQSLAEVWTGVSRAWRAACNGKAWDQAQRCYGVPMPSRGRVVERVPVVRVVEVTHGQHGWHVHVHALLLVRAGVTDREARLIGDAMWGRWDRGAVAAGLRSGSRQAMDAHLVTPGSEGTSLADYFTKAVYEATLGGVSKEGRSGSRTPFQILGDLMAHRAGERRLSQVELARDTRLWSEWETGSRGRRQISYSHGLRDWLALEVERTDQDIAEEDAGGEVVYLIGADAWRWIVRHGVVPGMLDAWEASDDVGRAYMAMLVQLHARQQARDGTQPQRR